eukprot:6195018-Pleurochrysis_carterae.AAC.1
MGSGIFRELLWLSGGASASNLCHHACTKWAIGIDLYTRHCTYDSHAYRSARICLYTNLSTFPLVPRWRAITPKQ